MEDRKRGRDPDKPHPVLVYDNARLELQTLVRYLDYYHRRNNQQKIKELLLNTIKEFTYFFYSYPEFNLIFYFDKYFEYVFSTIAHYIKIPVEMLTEDREFITKILNNAFGSNYETRIEHANAYEDYVKNILPHLRKYLSAKTYGLAYLERKTRLPDDVVSVDVGKFLFSRKRSRKRSKKRSRKRSKKRSRKRSRKRSKKRSRKRSNKK